MANRLDWKQSGNGSLPGSKIGLTTIGMETWQLSVSESVEDSSNEDDDDDEADSVTLSGCSV